MIVAASFQAGCEASELEQPRYAAPMVAQAPTAVNLAFAQYCETIFELAEDDVEVIQARIAERLGVSRPAVSEMMRRLELEGFVAATEDREIVLTAAGRSLAERTVRRHRLAERMLTDLLGLSWAESHLEAARWEGVISPTVEAAMDRVLGGPTTCPHGNPIPGSDYAAPNTVLLSQVRVGARFQVVRIPEELEFTAGLLLFLESAAVTPGNTGLVTASSPDGTLTVEVDGRRVGIGAFAAERIMVVLDD